MPAIREAAAAVRQLLVESVAKKWQVEPDAVEVRDGKISHAASKRTVRYVDAAKDDELAKQFEKPAPAGVPVTPVSDWKTMGTEHQAPAARAKVLGRHQYPTDLKRPGMLYGRVLRSPKYRAKLESVDLGPARAVEGVIAVRDGDFVGVAAPTEFAAKQAIEAVAKTAKWGDVSLPATDELYDYLRKNVEGGVPANPFAAEVGKAAKPLRATYTIAYVQHAPLEPRTALAEWADGKLTVWAGTQNPFGMRRELMEAFRLSENAVHVIVPDFGSGYGGKHTGESAVEAARLAQAAKQPVMLRWTREEEFTWAYFRPGGGDRRRGVARWRRQIGDVVPREHQRGRELDRVAVRCAAQALGGVAVAAAAAAWLVSGAGINGQYVRAGIVHGRARRRSRRRPARISADSLDRHAIASRVTGGGEAVQLE